MGISAYDTITSKSRLFSVEMPATMKVTVTGGAGFIGIHLRRALGDRGHNVRSFDVAASGQDRDSIAGDLLDVRKVARALDGMDTVVHLAAKHRFFGVSASEFQRVNVDGTRSLLDAATRVGVQRLVFYSSVAVYGEQPTVTTEDTVCRPVGPYGETKLAAERLVREWAATDHRRQVVIIRPTVVFGPGNKGNIFRLIRQIDRGWFLPVGPGDNVKSVAYVENLVAATLFLLDRMAPGVAIYNYADAPHLTFREIASLIHAHLGRRMPTWSLPVRPLLLAARPIELAAGLAGRDLPVRAAIQKMNKVTHHSAERLQHAGFVPPTSVESGLERMIDWYVESHPSRRKQQQ